ncbi:hypothetical protein [Bartonella sp. HY761]|uniref:hypothetical protein n=1 Tax=Bartonella sp. HY761 TaxID=2979330 RepID=UPI00220D2338|nr:hypothetical protein [Bartonella sp. HY761]UXN05264.1 hypothetical protein N6A79_08000 [Bartonella sp. HY761]
MVYYSAKERGFFASAEIDDCVEISDKQHQELLEGQSKGQEIISDKSGHPILKPLVAPTLLEVKTALKSAIDHDAEIARLKYITPGVGQSMTYQEKVNQAANYSKALAAYLKDPDNNKAPNENEYLLLKSSLGIDGDTLAEVAENITWAYALWEQVGAAIETIRLQTKASIDTATTVEQAQAIFDAVKWP